MLGVLAPWSNSDNASAAVTHPSRTVVLEQELQARLGWASERVRCSIDSPRRSFESSAGMVGDLYQPLEHEPQGETNVGRFDECFVFGCREAVAECRVAVVSQAGHD